MSLLSRRATSNSKALLRASGLFMAAVWASVALRDRDAWPLGGLLAAGLCALPLVASPRLAAALARRLMAPARGAFVGVTAAFAAGLSWWAVHRVLRDTPLSIDAAVYLAQARAMSHLHLGMPAPRPMQAFSNHFLLEGPDRLLYGVFPPGWPLVIVPFLWAGAPMLVGPALAALLVAAQMKLGGSVARLGGEEADGELAGRASVLLGLPSIARVLETADLLSHALVALLAALAIGVALDARREGRASTRRALAVGACIGLALAARLLDGLVLALAVAAAAGLRVARPRAIAWAAAGAAPFLLLLAVEQHAATGAWLLPTQSTYFERSDWPPHCHRLGFGVDVGCSVEHKGIVARYGPAGYDWHQGLRIVRERAGKVGEDLLSFAPLALLAFLPAAVGASAIDALFGAFVVAFTFVYALFYYGNAQFFGARHLFPVAPFLWLLVARSAKWLPHRRAAGWLDEAHVRAAGVVGVIAVATVAARGPWRAELREAHAYQDDRSDLRRALAAHGYDRAIMKTPDEIAVAAAVDPWRDGADRLFVLDDGSGVLELRRAHPELPFLLSLPHDDVGRLYAHAPPPGLMVELERAWPTFVRPEGLGASRARVKEASGGAVLRLAHAHAGASVVVPFEIAATGVYAVHVDGFAGPTSGDYALTLDGEPLPPFHGYAVDREPRKTDGVDRALSLGRHALLATCTGHDERSAGFDADLDDIVGERRPPRDGSPESSLPGAGAR